MAYNDIKHLLVEKLTSPVPLSRHVLEKILAFQDSPTVASFISDTLPTMDDIGLDTVFSYVFTPSFTERIDFAISAPVPISSSQLLSLVNEIIEENHSRIIIDNDGNEYILPLHDVNVARYMRLLHLDRDIPGELLDELSGEKLSSVKPILIALLRNTTFLFTPERTNLLIVLIKALSANSLLIPEMCGYMIDFIEANRIKNISDYEYKLFRLSEVYEKEADRKIFYSEELGATYADAQIPTPPTDRMKEQKQIHKDLTLKMKEILGYIHDEMPEAFTH